MSNFTDAINYLSEPKALYEAMRGFEDDHWEEYNNIDCCSIEETLLETLRDIVGWKGGPDFDPKEEFCDAIAGFSADNKGFLRDLAMATAIVEDRWFSDNRESIHERWNYEDGDSEYEGSDDEDAE